MTIVLLLCFLVAAWLVVKHRDADDMTTLDAWREIQKLPKVTRNG